MESNRSELRALLEAVQQPTQPAVPSGAMVGRDAAMFSEAAFERLKRDLIRECGDIVRDATKDFWSGEKITKQIEDAFDDIGLPIDREHKRETGNAVRGIVRWQGRIDKVLGGMALAVVSAVIYALAKLVGFNIPSPGAR